jgi:Magnesium chelatase, subunit ChlI
MGPSRPAHVLSCGQICCARHPPGGSGRAVRAWAALKARLGVVRQGGHEVNVKRMPAVCRPRPPPRPSRAGTSTLARRLTTMLPAMTLAEAIETTRMHRVAGFTSDRIAFVTTRPFRAPHHTISNAGAIIGSLVKDVTWLSRPQACSLTCAHGSLTGHLRRAPRRAEPHPRASP